MTLGNEATDSSGLTTQTGELVLPYPVRSQHRFYYVRSQGPNIQWNLQQQVYRAREEVRHSSPPHPTHAIGICQCEHHGISAGCSLASYVTRPQYRGIESL